MSPMLIINPSPGSKEAYKPTVWIPVYGNINLIEDLKKNNTLHVFFDSRQKRGVRKQLHLLNHTRGRISAIEASELPGKIYYSVSKNLINPLLSRRQFAVIINRELSWNVHIGRTSFLRRRYVGREDKTPDLPKNIISLY